jgi:hypothetical protein
VNEGTSDSFVSMANNIKRSHFVVGVGEELTMEMFGVRVGDGNGVCIVPRGTSWWWTFR